MLSGSAANNIEIPEFFENRDHMSKQSRHRKSTFLAALSLFALACGTASAQDNAMAKGETVVMQTYAGTIGNVHGLIAIEKGFCEKHGLKCELKVINSGPAGMQALIGKSIDVALPVTELVASSVANGAEVTIIGMQRQKIMLSVSARNETALPHRAAGYPAIMQDFKGMKIGVTGRGSGGEIMFSALLRGAGMQPSDVTYVGVGGPATAYTSMVLGKQVDAAVMFEPLGEFCVANKTCAVVVDMTKGEGSPEIKAMNGAAIPLVMRSEMVRSNPQLVKALVAAMRDAEKWFADAANFDELVKIYSSSINFGDIPNAEALRRTFIRNELPYYITGLKVPRDAVKANFQFALQNKLIDKPVDAAPVIWELAY